MTAPNLKKEPLPEPHVGEYAALQPLSGTKRVDESFVVHGVGRGLYIRMEETSKSSSAKQ